MSGDPVATAQWRALDREGEDTCRLAHAEHGWLLMGNARFRDAEGFAALDYILRCDEHFATLGADIAGTHAERDIRLRLHREGDRWFLNDEEQPQVAGATDLDLAFTPATNLMPLRRLLAGTDEALPCRAAWLRYPECTLAPLDQSYSRTGMPDVVSYVGWQTSFTTQLTVDASGFVTLYPELWEGEVRHEG
ncbi:MAG: putative glycolipid-binding domain-containing protein [Roseovarius sp.]